MAPQHRIFGLFFGVICAPNAEWERLAQRRLTGSRRISAPNSSASGAIGQRAGISPKVSIAPIIEANHFRAISILDWFLMNPVIESRSTKASSVMITSKAMLRPKLYDRVRKRHRPAFFGILHAATNCGDGLGLFEPVEHFLIAHSILHHEFRSAIHGQHERGFALSGSSEPKGPESRGVFSKPHEPWTRSRCGRAGDHLGRGRNQASSIRRVSAATHALVVTTWRAFLGYRN